MQNRENCVLHIWKRIARGHQYRWRIRHLRRRGLEAAASAILRIIISFPPLRRLPQGVVIRLEQLLIVSTDVDSFDRSFYLERNPDVRDAGVDPLMHYLRFGWAEGRSSSAHFDELTYRRAAGLLPSDQISGIGHYLAFGRARRQYRSAPVSRHPCPQILRPQDGDGDVKDVMRRLEQVRLPHKMSTQVDVVVPVYRGRAETLACIASVLEASNVTGFNLVVVDDQGPDQQLRADLKLLAQRGLIKLIIQPRNLGFAAAINIGTRGTDRDVIWLNADTEVFGNWIDRLRRAAYSAPDIATVTPVTNNGTICSYPRFNSDNCHPLELGPAALDRIAAEVNEGRTVDAPTCVGFATYVRRDAIVRVGLLDEAAFGLGYGEENDFSQRAIAAGLRNLIAGDVFVYHHGQTSFGDARGARVAAAMRVMAERHPRYARDVARFLDVDPMAPIRRAIDVARLLQLIGSGCRRVLMVTHSLGGGTKQHVGEEIARLTAKGAGVVLISGGLGGADRARFSHPSAAELPSLESVPLGGREFVQLIRTLGVTEVHVHHVADFGRDAARRFIGLFRCLGLPFEFTVHDYLPICPRINMADAAGMYCGEPEAPSCQRCLLRRRSQFGAPDIRQWRADYGSLLSMARRVRVPDRDVVVRLRRYFPQLDNVVVRPHEPQAKVSKLRRRRPGPLRIAAIGAIGPVKGFDVLLRLASAIRTGRHAAQIAVIGYTRNDTSARAAGIHVTGPYANESVQAEIAAIDPDVILIPSIWPETYCYTLSHALASGRPVAGFDIGAIGTRLRDAARLGAEVAILPMTMMRDHGAMLVALAAVVEKSRSKSTAKFMSSELLATA